MSTCARVNNRDAFADSIVRLHVGAAIVEPKFKLFGAHKAGEIRAVVRQLEPRAQHVLPPAQFRHQALAAGLHRFENGEPRQPADRKEPSDMAVDQSRFYGEVLGRAQVAGDAGFDLAGLPHIERGAIEEAGFERFVRTAGIEQGVDSIGRALHFLPCLAAQGLDAPFDIHRAYWHVDLLCWIDTTLPPSPYWLTCARVGRDGRKYGLRRPRLRTGLLSQSRCAPSRPRILPGRIADHPTGAYRDHPKEIAMESALDIGCFDLDIMLQDAALDGGNRPTRRMLANACIGVEALDAYYAARELYDALTAVHEGLAKAKGRLAQILSTRCDDLQRCLYYIVAGRGVVQMLEDLDWLLALLKARTVISRDLLRQGRHPKYATSPYISSQPDGPVPSASAEFELGHSWYLDPALGGRITE